MKKEYKFSAETRKRMSLARIGLKLSPETCERIRLAKTGHRHSEETRQKMSAAHKRRLIHSHLWKGGRSSDPAWRAFYERRRRARLRGNGGSHTFEQWEALKDHFSHTCPACLKTEPRIKLTEDHKMPLSLGGTDDIDNIQPLCARCNSKKKTKLITYLTPLL